MQLSTLCYLQHNGSTLMMHRNKNTQDPHLGKWNGLGGKMKPGETPEECVIREVFEESGLELERPRLHGFLTWPKFDGVEDWYAFIFTGNQFHGNLKKTSSEGDLQWIPDRDLLDLPLWEGDRIFMKWIQQKLFFSGKFVYENGVLVDHEVLFYDLFPSSS